jgi:hypothetical protein
MMEVEVENIKRIKGTVATGTVATGTVATGTVATVAADTE